MLFLISLGIFSREDISLKALDTIKKCDVLYFENYTGFYKEDAEEIGNLTGKEVFAIGREKIESGDIVKEAKGKDVGILVIGDVFSATTHISLFLDAITSNIKVEIIHGSSIFSAVAETGLSLYKFGAVASIPGENKGIRTPFEIFQKNQNSDYHTLFLLDTKDRMTVSQGIRYLLESGMEEDRLCVGCWQLGGNREIRAGIAKDLVKVEIDKWPQCLIVPGKTLHFMEEEVLNLWRLKQG